LIAAIVVATDIERFAVGSERSSHEAVDLPLCAYRTIYDDSAYRCEAAAGAIVSADDYRACSIPAAVSRKDACLYLTPLRHDGKACYACRWFFSSANEPVVDDWRKLCFCSYWFPRGPDERHVMKATTARRVHYLKVLRGDAPRRVTRTMTPVSQSGSRAAASALGARVVPEPRPSDQASSTS
jgi:hypothetical protein